MNNLQNSDYSEIFPENLKKYKNLRAFSNVIEKILKEYVLFDSEKISIFYTLEFQKDKVLDEIAWWLNVDNYSTALDREIKISLIKGAYWINANKGTKKAVIDQLKKLNYTIDIQEWFEYKGKPFTFRLVTKKQNNNPDEIKKIVQLIDSYKNVRSILDSIVISTEKEQKIYVGGYKKISVMQIREWR